MVSLPSGSRVSDRSLCSRTCRALSKAPTKRTWPGSSLFAPLQRTRVLIHLLEAVKRAGTGAAADYATLNEELRRFDPGLAASQLVTPRRLDLTKHAMRCLRCVPSLRRGLWAISAATGDGVAEP